MIKIYFAKLLKRLYLLERLNFSFSKKINGTNINIPFINGIGFTNYVLQPNWLDALIIAFVNETKGVFVDVGANIGQTLIRLKTSKPNVSYLGFEPNSSCTFYSQKLIRLNNFSNCIIHNCALSESVQNLVLEKTLVVDSRASVISRLRPDYFTDKEYVFALDYDSFYNDKPLAFVKIDVEGAELDVITGMRKSIEKYQPIITCEVLDSHNYSVLNYTQSRASELSAIIKSLHYTIIRLVSDSKTHKIKGFNLINTIKVQQWTKQSSNLNDYLFIPQNIEYHVVQKLNRLISL